MKHRPDRWLPVVAVLLALTATPAVAKTPDSPAGTPSSPLDQARSLLKQGRYTEAEVGVRQLLAEAEARHGADSLQVAEVLDVLVEALTYGVKSTDPETRALAERALTIKETALGPEDIGLAKSLLNLAIQRGKSGRFAEARPVFERALAIREKALGPDHSDVAEALVMLANIYRVSGDYATARPLNERALAIRERVLPADHPDVAQSLNALGILLWNMGDFSGAKPLLERALQIREKVLGPDHPEVGTTVSNLAIVIGETGDYEAARKLFERSVSIRERTLGPDHPDTARALNNLGILYTRTGDYARARPTFERALDIRERAQGPDHPDLAHEGLNNLGWLLTLTGEYDRARALLKRSLEMQERLLAPDHPDIGDTLINLARIHIDTGDYASAAPLTERALSIREKTLGPLHPYLGDMVNLEANVLAKIGETAKALDYALRAERIGRDHLRLTSRVLAERQALLYDTVRASGLDLALTLAAAGLAPDLERKAWDGLIRSRALVLDEMAVRHRAVGGGVDKEAARLGERLGTARTRLSNLLFRGPGPEGPEEYARLLDDSRQEKERAERALAEKSATFRAEQARGGVGMQEVVDSLPAGSALVAYARYAPAGSSRGGGQETGPRAARFAYVAFVLRSDDHDPVVIPLGPADAIEPLIRDWKEEGSSDPPKVPAAARLAESRYRMAAERVRRAIWDPVAEHLAGMGLVFVVADGPINLINLATLPAADGRYLVETGPLLHGLSAERDLARRRPPGASGEGLLVLGSPDYDTRSASVVAANLPTPHAGSSSGSTAYRGPVATCEGFRSRHWDPLPGARVEAEEIRSLWKRKTAARNGREQVLMLTGPQATEDAFKQAISGRRIVHVATHGFFVQDRCRSILQPEEPAADGPGEAASGAQTPSHPENPLLLSGLVLAGANHRQEAPADGEDGILTAEEIASLDLSSVEWAVLSACETGAGEVRAGEGVLGLRRAFEVAGASTLIMTLWKVQDDSAREWMEELYKARLKGQSTAEAVRAATLKILTARRRTGRDTHPFWWGAFVATGDWR